jgi:hypothetical protein
MKIAPQIVSERNKMAKQLTEKSPIAIEAYRCPIPICRVYLIGSEEYAKKHVSIPIKPRLPEGLIYTERHQFMLHEDWKETTFTIISREENPNYLREGFFINEDEKPPRQIMIEGEKRGILKPEFVHTHWQIRYNFTMPVPSRYRSKPFKSYPLGLICYSQFIDELINGLIKLLPTKQFDIVESEYRRARAIADLTSDCPPIRLARKLIRTTSELEDLLKQNAK